MIVNRHKVLVSTGMLSFLVLVIYIAKIMSESSMVASNGDLSPSKDLLTSQLFLNDASLKWTPLHRALYLKDIEKMRLLLKAGASPDVEDELGRTPLHHACLLVFDQAVALLLNYNAHVKIKDHKGYMPIHFAAGKNRRSWSQDEHSEQIMTMLLNHHVDCDVRDDRGRTPLHYASMYGSKNLVNLLISHGADVMAKDWHQATPLHYVSGKVKSKWVSDDNYCAIGEKLIAQGACPNVFDDERKTPLHYACAFGNQLIVNLLLQHGADASCRDFDYATPFHYACGKDTTRFRPLKYNPFIKAKAQEREYKDVYEEDQEKHLAIIKKLLSYNVDPMVVDAFGKLSSDYAQSNKHEKISMLLGCLNKIF